VTAITLPKLRCGNTGTQRTPFCGASSLGEIHNRQHQRVTGVSFAKTEIAYDWTVELDALNGRPTECEATPRCQGAYRVR
jgi:hypothetical protein